MDLSLFSMIIQMSVIAIGDVLLTLFLHRALGHRKMTWGIRIFVGVVYGLFAVFSTHFGVQFGGMIINERDLGPLCAGLFFDPISGIIAGILGGVERYIAGAYFGVGSYTRIACSVSTCLAGFVSAFMSIYIFNRRKPSAFYAFFMGAVMEVFHMYVVLITHKDDMNMAYYVVRICSIPMIIFCGLGLAACSVALLINDKEWRNPFKKIPDQEIMLAQKFEFWLFVATLVIIVANFVFTFQMQTRAAIQDASADLVAISDDIRETYTSLRKYDANTNILRFHVGSEGSFDIVQNTGYIIAGNHQGKSLDPELFQLMIDHTDEDIFKVEYFEKDVFCHFEQLDVSYYLVVAKPTSEVYYDRNAGAFETAFYDILMLTVIYVTISLLVQAIVVNNLNMVNSSLHRITGGDLSETVSVCSTSEFASLSSDINQTVEVLKGYINAAEQRMAQELEFARQIQESALPQNFHLPRNDVEIFATMDPAKEVGGDFYDFFFIDNYRFALVIADVSGKGIPASLFMMRSKAAIRSTVGPTFSPSEILEKVNNTLCEGNDTDMFVTVWIGIINLTTGLMSCANAGHEYPVIRQSGQDYELFKDKHSLALGTMDGIHFKEYELQLHPGDEIFVYTDGIPESINKDVKQYGTDRLLTVLNKNKDVPYERLLPRVRNDISNFCEGADQFDDITMMGFKYKG
jgi:hypothetical protein